MTWRIRLRKPWTPREMSLIAGLLVVGVLLPLVVSAVAGTLEIPRNDDWSYRRMSTELAKTGTLALDGISSTFIVGQILIAQPLLWLSGAGPTAFTVAGVLFATAGMLGAYVLARRFLRPRDAGLAAGLLAIFPGYLAYATSFMSDVPALATQFACLTLGAVAVAERPTRTRWLVAALTVGVFAFSMREFAIAAPASVAAVAIAIEPKRRRTWVMVLGTLGTCVALYAWRTSLPGQVPAVGAGFGSFPSVPQALSSVAFVVAPAALVGFRRWRNHLRTFDLVVGLELGLVLVVARVIRWLMGGDLESVIMMNLTSRTGAPASSYLLGGRPVLFGDPMWDAINIAALLSTVVVLTVGAGMLGYALRRSMRSAPMESRDFRAPIVVLLLFTLVVAGGLVAFSLSRLIIDRYFWVMVTPLAILLLRTPSGRPEPAAQGSSPTLGLARAASAMAVVLLLAATSLVYLLNSHAFDAGRWAAGERLVRAGYARDAIDAGYEWVGYHATTRGDPTNRSSLETFYRSWWSGFVPCAVVSGKPIAGSGWEPLGTTDYSLILFLGPIEKLYLYGSTDPGCP